MAAGHKHKNLQRVMEAQIMMTKRVGPVLVYGLLSPVFMAQFQDWNCDNNTC